MKRVLIIFFFGTFVISTYLAYPLQDVGVDAFEVILDPPIDREIEKPYGVEPVYGEHCRLFRDAKEKYHIAYGVYAEKYARRSQWVELSAPGIAVADNSLVRHYVNRFQTTRRRDFTLWLQRSGRYIPLMRQILVENGLPGELVCLAMVESGFDQIALSKAMAAGLWQFMPATARRYGLRVDEWVDERLDVESSTVAASQYLKDLYKRYNSWDLTIAAYNAGERRVSRITNRTGCGEFWELVGKRYFDIETRYHVIKFNAAVAIMRDLDGHGFFDIEIDEPLLYESVDVPAGTHLRRIAEILDIPEVSIINLNPQLIRYETPPDEPFYPLKVPFRMGQQVRENLQDKSIS